MISSKTLDSTIIVEDLRESGMNVSWCAVDTYQIWCCVILFLGLAQLFAACSAQLFCTVSNKVL